LSKVLLDLNCPTFLDDFFRLEKSELIAMVKALKKLSGMKWKEVYEDNGLKWEKIKSKKGLKNEVLHSFRITKKFRAIAIRQDDFLRILSLHEDHDSTYK
jgi:hypothetical protein